METRLTVTEASRHFSDMVNKVIYRGDSAILTKKGRDVARIIPTIAEHRTGLEAAKIMRQHDRLPAGEANRLSADLELARREGNRPQRDPWA